ARWDAVDVLHDEVIRTHIIECADVRVIQRCDRPRLAQEPVREVPLAVLDGNDPVETNVARFPDLTHAACAEWRQDLVGPDTTTNREGQPSDYMRRAAGHLSLAVLDGASLLIARLRAFSRSRCSRDRKHPSTDDDRSDDSRNVLTGGSETFDGDGCRHDSHRAKVHDSDDQEDRYQTGTALGAVESEAETVPPGRDRIGRECQRSLAGARAHTRSSVDGCVAAAGEVMRLPCGELEGAGDYHDHTGRDWYGARHRGLLHLDRRQRNTEGVSGHS